MVRSNCLYTLTALEHLYGSSTDLYIAVFNINELACFHEEVTSFDSSKNKIILFLSENIMHVALFVIYTLGWTVSVRSIDDTSFEIIKNESRTKKFVLSDDERIFLNELLQGARPEEISRRTRVSLKTIYGKRNRVLQKLNVKNINVFFILSPLIRDVFYN